MSTPEPYDQDESAERIDEMLSMLSDVFDGLEAYRLTDNEDYLTDAMWSLAAFRVAGGEVE